MLDLHSELKDVDGIFSYFYFKIKLVIGAIIDLLLLLCLVKTLSFMSQEILIIVYRAWNPNPVISLTLIAWLFGFAYMASLVKTCLDIPQSVIFVAIFSNNLSFYL